MHPLTEDLSSLKDEELNKKISDLSLRLNQAYRFGNYALTSQVQMVLEDYQLEQQRRYQKSMDEILSKSNKFSGIIDIQ